MGLIERWAIPEAALDRPAGETGIYSVRRVAPSDPTFAGEVKVVRADQLAGAVEERDALRVENARLRGEYADMAARLKREYELGMRDPHAGGQ